MEKWEVIICDIVLDTPIFTNDVSQTDLIPVAMIWHFTIYVCVCVCVCLCVCVCVFVCVCVWNELQLGCVYTGQSRYWCSIPSTEKYIFISKVSTPALRPTQHLA
jgi:hypothetical protein